MSIIKGDEDFARICLKSGARRTGLTRVMDAYAIHLGRDIMQTMEPRGGNHGKPHEDVNNSLLLCQLLNAKGTQSSDHFRITILELDHEKSVTDKVS